MGKEQHQKKLATRAVEAIGRGHLVSQLVREGIGVSLPLWDDGIDLIAHISDGEVFEATPLQPKVSTNTYVGIDHKYKTRPKMKMVFIWIDDEKLSRIYVMSYSKLYKLFKKHEGTASWKTGFYTSHASKKQLEQMEEFAFPSGKSLRQLIFTP